jgi:hypothetical protein
LRVSSDVHRPHANVRRAHSCPTPAYSSQSRPDEL